MEKTVQYNASYDVIFKNIMSDKRVIQAYLKTLLNMDVEEKDIEYYVNDVKINIKGKGSEMDVRFKIIKNEKEFDFEMQKQKPTYKMEDRLVYYASQILVNSTTSGQDYEKLKPIIIVCFCAYDTGGKNYEKIIEYIDTKTGEKFSELEKIYIYDLTKLEQCDNIKMKKLLGVLVANNLEEYIDGDDIVSEIAKKVSHINADELQREILRQLENAERERLTEENYRKATRELEKEVKKQQQKVEEDQQKLEENQQKLEEDQQKLEEDQQKLEESKHQFEEKERLIINKFFKLGVSIEEIASTIGISVDEVMKLK